MLHNNRNYLLAMLVLVAIFNSLDGFALGLVSQEIKRDLFLTDTQLGLVTGFAFSLMYALVGIAIARWADCGDRVIIIALTAVVWSVLVAACGMATSFVQLFFLRLGVGIGEAGFGPASQSLIADHFDRAARPQANALYFAGIGVAPVIGYGLAGALNEVYGWRVMFMSLGLPGIAIAIVTWITLKDPRFERSQKRTETDGWFALTWRALLRRTEASSAPTRLRDCGIVLWSNRTLRPVLLFWSVFVFFTTAVWQWMPAFFVRSHGLNTRELGSWYAVLYGLAGTLGPFLGGVWASRYARDNERLQLRVAAIVCCGVMILSAFIYLVSNHYVCFALLGLYLAAVCSFSGPLWAIVQTLVPANMRGGAVAIFAVLASLIGQGLAPLATGALSDALRAQFGEESLRYALLALCPGYLWSAWHLWEASKSVTRDLMAVREEHSEWRDVGVT